MARINFNEIKKIGIVIFLFGCVINATAQTNIALQDFESTPATPTLTFTNSSGSNSTGTNGSSGAPANSNLFVSGSRGWQVSNATSILTFANQSLSGYSTNYIDFRLAGMSLNSSNGIDAGDIVTVAISTDGGTTYSNELTVAGSTSNRTWDFTATGSASITYDGDNSPTAFTSASGSTGISTVTINLPSTVTQVRVKITLLNNDANERWVIDDVRIRGTLNSSPCSTPSAQPTGLSFGTVTSSSIPVSFTSASADGYLVIRTTTASQPSNPQDANTYTVGSTALGGYIESFGSSTSFTSSNLTPSTPYWYWVYAYNNSSCTGGPKYRTTSPLSDTKTTASASACATSSVNWNFTGGTATANTIPSNLSVSDLSLGNNNPSGSITINSTSASSGYTGSSGTNNAGAATFDGSLSTSSSTYFAFTLTPAAGYIVTLSGISFGSRSTNTGPAAFSLRSSLDNYASDIATGTLTVSGNPWVLYTPSISTPVSSASASPVTFRLYGYNGNNAAGGTVVWRVDDITLTVLLSPVLSSTLSPSAICSNATFSYIPSSNASGAGFSWTRAAVTGVSNPAITTDQTSNPSEVLTNNLTSSANVVYAYKVIANGCYNLQSVTVPVSANSWTGGTSTDWNNTANWSCGYVPTAASNVSITNVTNKPVLSADGSVNNLALAASTTFGINGHTLTINGAVTGSGTLTGSSASNLVLGGSSGTLNFTSGSQILYNLTLNTNATATLGSNLSIAAGTTTPGVLSVGSSAVFNTADGLTLLSDDNNTAIVGTVSGTINGKVTIQRYIHSSANPLYTNNGNTIVSHAKRAWRLLTAPVAYTGSPTIQQAWQNSGIAYNSGDASTQGAGTLITGPAANPATNGLDVTNTSTSSLKGFSVSNQKLVAITNTLTAISSNNLSSGNANNVGYFLFVRGDRNPATSGNPQFGGVLINNTTLSVKGALQTGDQLFSSTNNQLTTTAGGASLIGNPYACPVDFSKLANDIGQGISPYPTSSLVNIVNRFYRWDPNLNTVGGYETIDDVAYTGTYTKSVGGVAQTATTADINLQSGEAVFLMTRNAGASSVTFKESYKTTANNNLVFRPQSVIQSMRSNLYLLNDDNSTLLADGNVAEYNDAYAAEVDFLDAPKFGNVNENFSLQRDGHLLSIERRPVITSVDTLFFELNNSTQRKYQLQFISTSINPGLIAYLKDSYTNDSTVLNLDGSATAVNFNIDSNVESQNAKRFMVIFRPGGIVPVTYTSIKASQQGNDISVQWNIANQTNIRSYVVEKSTDGIHFYALATINATNENGYNWLDNTAINGDNYYRVYATGSNGVLQYSQIVKVKIGISGQAIAVYPNPVKGSVIGLEFNNMPKGNYQFQLINTVGQNIYHTDITHTAGSGSQLIKLNKTLSKGVYYLKVIEPGNKIHNISINVTE